MHYMVAQRGGRSRPIKITTIQFFPDLNDFIRQCHIDYINHCSELAGRTQREPWAAQRLKEITFGMFLNDWMSSRYVVYECKQTDINKRTGKRKQPTNICKYREKYDKENREWLPGKDTKLRSMAAELGFNVDE